MAVSPLGLLKSTDELCLEEGSLLLSPQRPQPWGAVLRGRLSPAISHLIGHSLTSAGAAGGLLSFSSARCSSLRSAVCSVIPECPWRTCVVRACGRQARGPGADVVPACQALEQTMSPLSLSQSQKTKNSLAQNVSRAEV